MTSKELENRILDGAGQLASLRNNIESLTRLPNILIVEDNVSDSDILFNSIALLIRANVVNTLTAEGALDILKTKTFDVIFLDLKLPKMSGVGLIKSISDQNIKKIVIVTGLKADFEDTIEAIKLGVVKVIYKPVTENDLRTIFGNAI